MSRPNPFSIAIENNRGGVSSNTELATKPGGPVTVGPRDAKLIQKLLHLRNLPAVVSCEPNELNFLIAILGRDLDQIWRLLATRRSPMCPKIEDYDFPS